MTAPDDLTARTRQRVAAAHHRYRTRGGMGALCTPPVPAALLDALADVISAAAWDAVETAQQELRAGLKEQR